MRERIAVNFIGAYREFYKNIDNFERFLTFLGKEKDVVVFAYVSEKSQYQRWHNEVFKKREWKFYRESNELNEKLFVKTMDKLGIPYVLEYYKSLENINIVKEDGIKNIVSHRGMKNIVLSGDTFVYQMLLEKRCGNMMIKYEKENNVRFDRVIRTRPDIYYKSSLLNNEMFNNEKFLYNLDFFYICNRNQYEILFNKIEYLDFTNYIGHRWSLYVKLKEKIEEKKIVYIPPIDFNHYLNKSLMDLNGFESKIISDICIYRWIKKT